MLTKAKFKYAFFDTSSLMHGNLEAFWSISAPALIEAGTQIIISNSCVKELEKHINSNDPYTATLAQKAWASIVTHKELNMCFLYGDPDDGTFADGTFLWVFQKQILRHSLLLITQDRNLASDIKSINSQKSRIHTHRAEAMKLLPNGTLSRQYA